MRCRCGSGCSTSPAPSSCWRCCTAVALVVRRRVIARSGGTFELSHRVRSGRPGRGWLLGVGRYSEERLEWFRIFSLSPRPKRSWIRDELTYLGRREPEGAEQVSLFPDHVVIACAPRRGRSSWR